MWVVRELLRLVERVVFGFCLALVIAAIWALAGSGSFAHSLHITTISLGAILLLLGAMGRDSNFERRMDASVVGTSWMPMMGSSRRDDPTLRPGLVLAISGIALLAFGFAVPQ